MRNGAGGLNFDPEFVPPCISIAASPRLLLIIRRLTSLLEEKAAALASERTTDSVGGSTQREVFSFWYLHCINSGLAELQHLLQIKNCHPVELFRAMLRLGGSLCTFVLGPDLNNPRIFSAPRDLPGIVPAAASVPARRPSTLRGSMKSVAMTAPGISEDELFQTGAHWQLANDE